MVKVLKMAGVFAHQADFDDDDPKAVAFCSFVLQAWELRVATWMRRAWLRWTLGVWAF